MRTASDGMLVSDYGYGAATPRLLTFVKSDGPWRTSRSLSTRAIAFSITSGVTAATPNEPEVEEALGDQDWPRPTRNCTEPESNCWTMKLDSLVITRGRDGMVAFESEAKPVTIPDLWL